MPSRITRGIAMVGRIVANSMLIAPRAAITAATVALTSADFGRTIILNRAAGITVTLPAATGSGGRIRIYNKTTVTSNSHIVQVVGNDIMQGRAYLGKDSADTVDCFETATDSDTMTMNGTTTGGLKGDVIELEDVAADEWAVTAHLAATGTEATPFSAAVS